MSLVVSRLDYCNAVLAGFTRVHNCTSATSTECRRSTHTWSRPSIPHQTGITATSLLPVRFRMIYKIATLMYSVLHRRCPQYLLELITFRDVVGRRCLRSTTSRAAIVQRTRTQLGHQTFSVCGPTIWNSLPKTLPLRLTDNNYQQFRRLLKTYLFNLAFN